MDWSRKIWGHVENVIRLYYVKKQLHQVACRFDGILRRMVFGQSSCTV